MAQKTDASRKTSPGVFERVRDEIANVLGIDPDHASFAQRLKLDRAVALRIEIDRQQSQQMAGQSVDVARLTAAAEELEKLLPLDGSARDMSKLSDDEVRIMERIIAKMEGEPVEDVVETFRLELVSPQRADATEELEELRRKVMQQNITLESQRVRIAKLEEQLVNARPTIRQVIPAEQPEPVAPANDAPSPSLPAATRQRFEMRIPAGEGIPGHETARARGKLPSGRPTPAKAYSRSAERPS